MKRCQENGKEPAETCLAVAPLGLFLALLMLPVLAYSAPLGMDVEVRAVLLFNFMRFAEWPKGTLGPDCVCPRSC